MKKIIFINVCMMIVATVGFVLDFYLSYGLPHSWLHDIARIGFGFTYGCAMFNWIMQSMDLIKVNMEIQMSAKEFIEIRNFIFELLEVTRCKNCGMRAQVNGADICLPCAARIGGPR